MSTSTVRERRNWGQDAAPTCGRPCIPSVGARNTAELTSGDAVAELWKARRRVPRHRGPLGRDRTRPRRGSRNGCRSTRSWQADPRTRLAGRTRAPLASLGVPGAQSPGRARQRFPSRPTPASSPAAGFCPGFAAAEAGTYPFHRKESVMPQSCCGQRTEICRACGGDLGREYHYALGACYCVPCWRAIARTRTGAPPAQSTLPGVALAQPQGPR
jgi:hypothetical protein